MSKHAEIIFETGAKSVLSYDDEAELKAFLGEHHRRAVNGEPGASQDYQERTDIEPELATQAQRNSTRPAERITSVLLYDEHPADLHDESVSVDTLADLVSGMSKDGKVDPQQLIRALRDEVSPVYPQDQGRHASIYKAEESGQLDLTGIDEWVA